MRLLLCKMYASETLMLQLPHARPTIHCIPLVLYCRYINIVFLVGVLTQYTVDSACSSQQWLVDKWLEHI